MVMSILFLARARYSGGIMDYSRKQDLDIMTALHLLATAIGSVTKTGVLLEF